MLFSSFRSSRYDDREILWEASNQIAGISCCQKDRSSAGLRGICNRWFTTAGQLRRGYCSRGCWLWRNQSTLKALLSGSSCHTSSLQKAMDPETDAWWLPLRPGRCRDETATTCFRAVLRDSRLQSSVRPSPLPIWARASRACAASCALRPSLRAVFNSSPALLVCFSASSAKPRWKWGSAA